MIQDKNIQKRCIAVLITVHNRKATTIECLRHLFQCQHMREDLDVYMVDDGCTDGTPECVKELFPDVHVISGTGQLYWNRGMHLAWTEALKSEYDFYLWLNDDTFLYKNAIEMMLNVYSNVREDSIIAGPTCCTSNPKTVTYGGLVKSRLLIPDGNVQEIDQFWGNIVLVPHKAVEKIGILDPYFCHTMGDSEYSFRAKRHGIHMYITPSFCGECDLHSDIPVWQNPHYSVIERLKYLHSPLGNPPCQLFYLYSKYKSFIFAASVVLMIYLITLLPNAAPKAIGWVKKTVKAGRIRI